MKGISDKAKYRLLEIFPGATVWVTLLGAVALSFFQPLAAIVFIIVFDLIWFFRVAVFLAHLFSAWRKYRSTGRTDWMTRLASEPNSDRLFHLVFLPTFHEDIGVIRTTLRSLAATAYPKERMLVVLAGEERDAKRFLRNADIARREFGNAFGQFLITLHPADLPDEIPGKGSNLHWSGHRARELVDRLGIPYGDVIVSTFDIDTVVHPQYFAYLSAQFLSSPRPTRTSFQPIALYNNNIWESPAPARIAAFGTTFWIMTELSKSDHLITFSSHSMSFRALVDVGFWQKDIVTEDSRIFLQCLTHYHGDYTVTPLYLPVSMDAVSSGTYVRILVGLYRQMRRWAWGVEHFPYVVWNLGRDPQTPLGVKFKYIWNAWEGMFSWATAPVIIFLMGRLPLWVAGGTMREVALVENAPFTLEWIMNASMIGVMVSAALSLLLLPKPPARFTPAGRGIMLAQWMLLPVTFIIFGAVPAIDAQTRLLLGRYMGFNVTEKVRSRRAGEPSLAEAVGV